MTGRLIRIIGLFAVVIYASFIAWVYARQPRSFDHVAGGISAGLGTYRVDQPGFDEGLRFFRNDQFVEARAAFARADPAELDSRTQFYIAYSFYRQGWGRLYHDDALYRQGLAVIDHAIATAPGGRIAVDDPNLGIRTADELKAALERGSTTDLSDFNPLRVFQRRR